LLLYLITHLSPNFETSVFEVHEIRDALHLVTRIPTTTGLPLTWQVSCYSYFKIIVSSALRNWVTRPSPYQDQLRETSHAFCHLLASILPPLSGLHSLFEISSMSFTFSYFCFFPPFVRVGGEYGMMGGWVGDPTSNLRFLERVCTCTIVSRCSVVKSIRVWHNARWSLLGVG
jgi:hypothetical protein